MGNEVGILTAFNNVRYKFMLRRPSPRVCTNEERSHGDVIAKFSRHDGLPILFTYGASLARFAR